MKSGKWSLNQEDWKRWGRNLLIFFAPAVVAFLTALQTGQKVEQAEGAFIYGLYGAVIDLFLKFKSA
jgi:hypothetical protein